MNCILKVKKLNGLLSLDRLQDCLTMSVTFRFARNSHPSNSPPGPFAHCTSGSTEQPSTMRLQTSCVAVTKTACASLSSRRFESPIIRQMCDFVELGNDGPRTST